MSLCLKFESNSLAFLWHFNNVLGFFSVWGIGRKKKERVFVYFCCWKMLLTHLGDWPCMLLNFIGNFFSLWYVFHILIDTAIFISFNFYDSDSQTTTGRERKNEIEALRSLFKDFFRPPGKFFYWLSLLICIGKN